MNHFRELILLACFVVSASALAQGEFEMRVYDVEPGSRDEIFSSLQRLIPGTVEILPSGQVVINTTPDQHGQVAMLLEAISSHEAEPTPRVTLQYWVVLGSRSLTDEIDMPASLENVLDEIRQVHGPLSFRLLGNATLVTDSGMNGRTQGEMFVSQLAYVQGARLQAGLEIGFNYQALVEVQRPDGQAGTVSTRQPRSQSLNLNTSMEQGEYVVVGENSITDNIVGMGEVDGTIFYIVHWPAVD